MYLSESGSYTIGSVNRPTSSRAKSDHSMSWLTVWVAKNSGSARMRVISQVACSDSIFADIHAQPFTIVGPGAAGDSHSRRFRGSSGRWPSPR